MDQLWEAGPQAHRAGVDYRSISVDPIVGLESVHSSYHYPGLAESTALQNHGLAPAMAALFAFRLLYLEEEFQSMAKLPRRLACSKRA
jgi:hypothetical protein